MRPRYQNRVTGSHCCMFRHVYVCLLVPVFPMTKTSMTKQEWIIFVWKERGRTWQMERIISPVICWEEKQRQKNDKYSEENAESFREKKILCTLSVSWVKPRILK